jgi:hypothetical protein
MDLSNPTMGRRMSSFISPQWSGLAYPASIEGQQVTFEIERGQQGKTSAVSLQAV